MKEILGDIYSEFVPLLTSSSIIFINKHCEKKIFEKFAIFIRKRNLSRLNDYFSKI